MNISMEFIPFCPDVMKMRILSIFKIKFQRKRRKQPKNEIRPANCKIDGLAKLFVRADISNEYLLLYSLRTTIPVRGRNAACCTGSLYFFIIHGKLERLKEY